MIWNDKAGGRLGLGFPAWGGGCRRFGVNRCLGFGVARQLSLKPKWAQTITCPDNPCIAIV